MSASITSRSLRTGQWKRTCNPGLQALHPSRCRVPSSEYSTLPDLEATPGAGSVQSHTAGKKDDWFVNLIGTLCCFQEYSNHTTASVKDCLRGALDHLPVANIPFYLLSLCFFFFI